MDQVEVVLVQVVDTGQHQRSRVGLAGAHFDKSNSGLIRPVLARLHQVNKLYNTGCVIKELKQYVKVNELKDGWVALSCNEVIPVQVNQEQPEAMKQLIAVTRVRPPRA